MSFVAASTSSWRARKYPPAAVRETGHSPRKLARRSYGTPVEASSGSATINGMLPRRARSGQAWKSARGAAAALLDRAGEYAERGPKRTLGDDGEDPSFFPRRIDRRPA